jgi:hypothetical protein
MLDVIDAGGFEDIPPCGYDSWLLVAPQSLEASNLVAREIRPSAVRLAKRVVSALRASATQSRSSKEGRGWSASPPAAEPTGSAARVGLGTSRTGMRLRSSYINRHHVAAVARTATVGESRPEAPASPAGRARSAPCDDAVDLGIVAKLNDVEADGNAELDGRRDGFGRNCRSIVEDELDAGDASRHRAGGEERRGDLVRPPIDDGPIQLFPSDPASPRIPDPQEPPPPSCVLRSTQMPRSVVHALSVHRTPDATPDVTVTGPVTGWGSAGITNRSVRTSLPLRAQALRPAQAAPLQRTAP